LAVGKYSPDLLGAYASGVSILEARLDLFPRTDASFVREELSRLRAVGLPMLATFRPKREGGAWGGGEDERKVLLLESLPLVDAVDIELLAADINAEVAKAVKKAGKTLIISNHTLDATPENPVLRGRLEAAEALGADIVKLACLAKAEADVARLLAFVGEHRRRGLVGISMGPHGAVSRVAAPLFGSLLTYTSRELNYGQLPLEDQVRILETLYPEFRDDLAKRRHPLDARVP
jgi:3-dehydroquinate dehydratase type I